MICKSCGAKYNVKEPKCPFCGTMNEKGAKRQFFKRLLGITDTIEDMSQEPRKVLIKKTAVALLIVTAVTFLGVTMVLYTKYIKEKSIEAKDAEYEKKEVEQIEWENEIFPQFDELYAQKQFEQIIERRQELLDESYFHDIYNWRHFKFISIYEHYASMIQFIKDSELKEQDKYDKGMALFHAMSLVYDCTKEKLADYIPEDFENSNQGLTEEELELIAGYRIEAQKMMTDVLKVTKEDQKTIYDNSEYGISISECDNYFR